MKSCGQLGIVSDTCFEGRIALMVASLLKKLDPDHPKRTSISTNEPIASESSVMFSDDFDGTLGYIFRSKPWALGEVEP